jgi:hypothetical protein
MPDIGDHILAAGEGGELDPANAPGWAAGDFVNGGGLLGVRPPASDGKAGQSQAQLDAFFSRGYAERAVSGGATGGTQVTTPTTPPSSPFGFEIRPASVSPGDAMNAIAGLLPAYWGPIGSPILGALAGKAVDNDTHLTPGDVVGTAVGIGTSEWGPEVSIPASFLAGKLADQYAYGFATGVPPGVLRGRAMQAQQPYPGYYDVNGEPWYDNH